MAEERNGPAWWERLPGHPIGSVEEAKRFNIPLGKVHTCSAPDDNRNLGCPCADVCRLKFSYKFLGDKARPRNGGIEIIKQTSSGTVTRRDHDTCYGYNWKRKALEDNEGVVDWIADEGEESEVDETAYKIVKQLEGKPPEYGHVKETVKKKVAEFVSLSQRPEVRNALRLEQRRAEAAIQREEERRNRHLGLTDEPQETVVVGTPPVSEEPAEPRNDPQEKPRKSKP